MKYAVACAYAVHLQNAGVTGLLVWVLPGAVRPAIVQLLLEA
jgi:hypothetical protein